MNINSVTLAGFATRDFETRSTQGGLTVASGGLAVNNRVKAKDGKWTDGPPLFVDLVAWAKTGEAMAQQIKKGDNIVVHGRLKLEQWTAQDGSKRSKHSVVISEWGKIEKHQGAPGARAERDEAAAATNEFGDLPF